MNAPDIHLAIQQETVNSLPLRKAIRVSPATIIRAAVAMMRNEELGCAVIMKQDQPIGVFTERSLLEVLIHDPRLDSLRVGDFADPGFRVVKTSDPISVVWQAIQEEGFRFICVTNEDGQLIGLTGQRGLAEYAAEYFPQQVTVQRLGCKPWMATREGA